MGKVLLISGTDTGVGKTFFSYLLCKALKKIGVRVSYWKPIETGVENIPSDASLLAELLNQPLEESVGYTFRLPVAPYVAEKYEGEKVSLKALREQLRAKADGCDLLVVEGAGGLAVPIKKNYTYGDFAAELNLPVLVVANARLGTINHSVLTAYYAEGKGVNLLGFAMNRFSERDFSERDNPRVVEEMTGKPVLFRIKEGNLKQMELKKEEVEKLLRLLGV